MELMFNELSVNPLSLDQLSASEKMLCFIDVIKAAQKRGVRKVRSDHKLNQIKLTPNISIQDWILMPENHKYRDFILGSFIHPFLNIETDEALIEYSNSHYTFQHDSHEVSETECLGLAAASIYELPVISFSGYPLWESPKLLISVKSDKGTETEEILNIAKENRLGDVDFEYFFENFGDLVLPKTSILPEEKKFHLADHHGKDELTVLCKKLINNPYVVEMRSMEWCQGKCVKFIKKFHKNGVVEIVLINSRRKYGLWVQTTGANYRQTKAISEILEDKYS